MKTTAENNRLIAEFMGYQVVNKPKVVEGENFFQYLDEKTNKYAYCASLLMYNYSWDWLMPVVEKIKSKMTDPKHLGAYVSFESRLKDALWTSRENTYNQVVQFIEWYNENKN